MESIIINSVIVATTISGVLAFALIPELVLLGYYEYHGGRGLTKFVALLAAMGLTQFLLFLFFSAGQYFQWWYIWLPKLESLTEVGNVYLIIATIYNTLSIPKWLFYIAYIYYRSVGLSSISQSSSLRKQSLGAGIAFVLVVWIVLLIELYVTEYYTYQLFVLKKSWARSALQILETIVLITRYIAGLSVFALDLFFQYRFYIFIKEFKAVNNSRETIAQSTQYFIVAQHCFAATWFSMASFVCIVVRDLIESTEIQIYFELLYNFFGFLIISNFVSMKYRSESHKKLQQQQRQQRQNN